MAVELVLLRHGEAERQAAHDDQRRLTPRGMEEARAVGGRLARLSLPVPVVVSSPFLRAKETAEIVAETLGAGAVRELADITPDDDPRRALLVIAEHCVPGATLVVVTHMPLIGNLLALLVEGSVQHPPGVRTAGGAWLQGAFVAPGAMQVRRSFV